MLFGQFNWEHGMNTTKGVIVEKAIKQSGY